MLDSDPDKTGSEDARPKRKVILDINQLGVMVAKSTF